MAKTFSKNGKPIGRPNGGVSFTKVQLRELTARLPDTAVIPVSRVWLKKIGFEVTPAPVADMPAASPSQETSPVELTVS